MAGASDGGAEQPDDGRLRVAVVGAAGRMGRMLVDAVAAAGDLRLSGALVAPGHAAAGRDAGVFLGGSFGAGEGGRTLGVTITDDAEAALAGAAVMIDFSRPGVSLRLLDHCRAHRIKAVVGTTGFNPAQQAAIAGHAAHIAIVQAPNMSVGVNVVLKLLDVAARSLAGHDIEVIEAHHRHKVDAPSGTALQMGAVLAAAIGSNLGDCAVRGRDGLTGARAPGTIGFSSVRGGDIVGDHTVLFAGTGERIEITHRSTSRGAYADGSLRAARFVATQAHGLFSMSDVLGLHDRPADAPASPFPR